MSRVLNLGLPRIGMENGVGLVDQRRKVVQVIPQKIVCIDDALAMLAEVFGACGAPIGPWRPLKVMKLHADPYAGSDKPSMNDHVPCRYECPNAVQHLAKMIGLGGKIISQRCSSLSNLTCQVAEMKEARSDQIFVGRWRGGVHDDVK